MFYISISGTDANALVYYCRNCGNEDTITNMSDMCVMRTQVKQTAQSFNHIINKYTKLDPTLPRINTILCPNPECPTNHAKNPEPREIIYIRYDDTNMKYIYLCSNDLCNTSWKTDEVSS